MNTISSMMFFLANKGMGRALRHRDYAIYAAAGWLSNIGLWVQRIAVGWLTWTFTESFLWLGVVVFAEGLATTVIIPIAGTYVDRVDRLFLGRLTQMGLILIAAVLATLTFLGLINIWILLVLMVLSGIAEGFWTPVRLSIPPNLVPRKDLSSALGINASLFNLAQFVGPAVAGVFIAVFDTSETQFGFAFAFNSVTFLAYLLVLFKIRFREGAAEERQGEQAATFFEDFMAGLRYVRRTNGLLLVLMLMMSTSLFMRPFREMFPGISDEIFQRGAEGLAVLTGATGIGAVFGALLIANLGKVEGLVRLVLGFFVFNVIIQLVFAFSPTFIVAVATVAGMGFAVTAAGIGGQVLVQSAIHDEMRGRVMGLWGIIMRGGVPTGAVLLGALNSWLGFRWGMVAVTLAFVVVLAYVIPRSNQLSARLEAVPTGGPDS